MPGWGGFAEIVAGWVLDENGLTEFKKRLESNRLSSAFKKAHAEWRRLPTPDNKRKRDDALAVLTRWSDAP
jgi:hypothetical protein